MTIEQREQFIQGLIAGNRQKSHLVYMPYFAEREGAKPGPLFNILGIGDYLLNDDGKQLLDYLESDENKQEGYLTYENFKWKVNAFLCIQDNFEGTMYPRAAEVNTFQLRYFYYESKYLLIESIVSSLNGLHIGNKQLLRNFIEFNLLQNYFENTTRQTHSYQTFAQYIKSGHTPKTHTLITKAIPNDSFCKPLKKAIQLELNNLSNKFSHAYSPVSSPKQEHVFTPGITLETLYFWIHVSIVLDKVLWMYYVNMPMLFFPVNTIKKFGFNGPVGIYTSVSNGIAIEKSMSPADYSLFKNYFENNQRLEDNMNWYHTEDDKNDEEIWKTWNRDRDAHDSIDGCFIKQQVELRGWSESLSVGKTDTDPLKDKKTDDFLENFLDYSGWMENYSSLS